MATKVSKDAQTQTEIAIQASGEEIDAEVAKANTAAKSSQKKPCEHCPHCNSSIKITVHNKTNDIDTPQKYSPPPKSGTIKKSKPSNKNVQKPISSTTSKPAKSKSDTPNVHSTVHPKQHLPDPMIGENRYAALSIEEMETDPISSNTPPQEDPPDLSALQEAVLTEHVEEEITHQSSSRSSGNNKPVSLDRSRKV